MTCVPAIVVRACIGRAILGSSSATHTIGRIDLHPHQRDAIARIERALDELGGALLADETGLGKTFVALAIARPATHPLVVAPAALRDMWRRAMADAACPVAFRSIESLGRRPRATGASRSASDRTAGDDAHDLVIVDEAHHARNPATARYRALAALTARSRILLLSATPVHNSTGDLESLLALFLGHRARSRDPALAARCIIRRAHHDAVTGSIPRVLPTIPLAIDHDEALLDAIAALPPPIPPSDGGEAALLLSYSLIRQWASSQGALRRALRRRLARATALLAALETGRYPTRTELAAWTFAESALQLALPGLVVAASGDDRGRSADRAALANAIERHAAAIRALLDAMRAARDPDVQRAAHLDALRTTHPGAHIVAFTQFAETADAMFACLRHRPRICVLTAAGAGVAGGSISRAEALARFAPRAHGRAPAALSHAIDLLIATDLLSEGVNLHDASVVVHLDLPWTPARIEQRIGRVARLGSTHAAVHVYAIEPPAGAESILRLEERLRAKLGAAARTVGVVGAIMPRLLASEPRPGLAAVTEAIRAAAAEWATGEPDPPATHQSDVVCPDGVAPSPLIAAVSASVTGWIAVATPGARGANAAAAPRIVVNLGDGATDAPDAVLRAMLLASGVDALASESAVTVALRQVEQALTGRALAHDLSIDAAVPARARRRAVERIAAITRRTPRHLRPAIASLAAGARRSVVAHVGAGAERILAELADAPMADDAWLRALKAFGEVHAGGVEAEPERLTALLLLIAPNGA